MTLQLDRPLVVLDTETTGVDPEIDRIVQIGIVLVSRDHERQEWEFYIDPEEPIPPEATEIHGISDVIVQGKPPFVQIWPLIAEIIDGADIVAYNARFDLAMIDAELKRAALPKWDRSGVRVIDPLVIFRARHPHTLEGACKEYGVG